MSATLGPSTVIRPSRGWVAVGLEELWEYRELLYFFVWRDIRVRYKQTVLGVAWAVIQPVSTMLLFSLFFGRLARMPSEGVPYPLFTFAALVPWTMFSVGVSQSASSLVVHQNLIRKVYFPRLAIPTGTVLSGLVDFGLTFLLLLAMALSYGEGLTARVVWIPLPLLLAVITTLGTGLWLAALNVQYRDVQYAVPLLIQLWLYATPIAYPSTLLDQPWRTVYAVNPMVTVVEGFRWALLGTPIGPFSMILASSITGIALLVTGAFYFRRAERSFADVV